MDRIYFISDAHFINLPDRDRKQEAIFESFIGEVTEKGGALFLVGDLFDFWFEYQSCIPKYYFHVLYLLKKASENGVKINVVCGNHDYWHMDFFKKFIDASLYRDSAAFKSAGKSFFVTHGDGILLSDKGYRLLKPIMQSGFITKLTRMIHPDIANRAIRRISAYSRGLPKNHIFTGEMKEEIRKWARRIFKMGYDYVIIGHYHKPFVEEIEDGKILMCTGDWLNYFTFGYFDGRALSLCYWERSGLFSKNV